MLVVDNCYFPPPPLQLKRSLIFNYLSAPPQLGPFNVALALALRVKAFRFSLEIKDFPNSVSLITKKWKAFCQLNSLGDGWMDVNWDGHALPFFISLPTQKIKKVKNMSWHTQKRWSRKIVANSSASSSAHSFSWQLKSFPFFSGAKKYFSLFIANCVCSKILLVPFSTKAGGGGRLVDRPTHLHLISNQNTVVVAKVRSGTENP